MENQVQEKPKTKLNKTWILVALLVIITGILLVISLTAKNAIIGPNKDKNAQVVEEVAKTSLAFSNDVRPGATPGTYEADINIDTSDNKVTLVQLEMSYDPKELTGVDIKPGSFINQPDVIQKNINTTDGRIKYWIGVKPNQNGVIGKGVVATVTFSKPTAGGSQINFLPKTSVSAAGTDQSVLKNMLSGYFETNQTPTQSSTNTAPSGAR